MNLKNDVALLLCLSVLTTALFRCNQQSALKVAEQFAILKANRESGEVGRIELAGLLRLITQSRCKLVDIRSLNAFVSGHLPGAIPLTNLASVVPKQSDARSADRGLVFIVYGESGGAEAGPIAEQLAKTTGRKTAVYSGGYREWIDCGLAKELVHTGWDERSNSLSSLVLLPTMMK